MRVVTTVQNVVNTFAAAHAAIPPGVCRKCWSIEFHQAAFGCNGETYTLPQAGGMWLIDADKANEICGGRIDAYIPPETIATGSGEREGTHELCLLRRLDDAKGEPRDVDVMSCGRGRAGGIIAEVGGVVILIDGTHRGRLCAASGVSFPVSLMTPAEFDSCVVMRPGDDVLAAADRELDRVTKMFRRMNADEFFRRTGELLGKQRLRELMGIE